MAHLPGQNEGVNEELALLDATAQAELVRTGQVSAAELVVAAIERIEALNPVLNAVVNRDFPVIQGFTLVIAVFFLLMNILADMMYALLDPRIRY